jgi:rubrerythrin
LKGLADPAEREILALAISLEEEHGRIYADYAEGLRASYPASSEVFVRMAAEENEHRRWLLDLYRAKFGDHIPLIRRQDVKGFVRHEPIWMVRPLGPARVRRQAEEIEYETRRFYEDALERVSDAGVRKLLGDLIAAEREHANLAQRLGDEIRNAPAKEQEEEAYRRAFVLRVVQPGLDGSVSTLAPLFAAAFATHSTWQTFLVGLAASVGAGISMGFAEALSDDGSLTGRGRPLLRGTITGAMTALGGLGHTLPYLISTFSTATAVAIAVVFVELWVIAWIRAHYLDTRFLRAAFEVVLGGLIVFAVGILIGSA